jgi:putative phosphonate metabolism protein
MAARYAIYWAPPRDDALYRFGNEWLGRDAETGEVVAQPTIGVLTPAALADLTAEPRRYGFHATLKPPFALAAGQSEVKLIEAARRFAAGRTPFSLTRLSLVSLGGFLALVPAERSSALETLAADCVTEFDAFRAPPGAAELARRRNAGLSPRQEALLERWGYPYVMEEFRFHLTLTRRLAAGERARLEPELRQRTLPFAQAPLEISEISLFREAEPGAPLTIAARFPFGSS